MQNFFTTCTTNEQKALPSNTVEGIVSACQQDALTGVLRVEVDAGPCVLTFLGGEVDAVYQFRDECWTTTPHQEWKFLWRMPARRWGSSPVDVDGLRICKLFLGAYSRLVEIGDLTLSEVAARLRDRLSQVESALFHLRIDENEFFVVVPGRELSFLDGVSFSADQAGFFVSGVEDLPLRQDGLYRVSVYRSHVWQDVWREYHLRLAFMAFVRVAFARMGELFGQLLIQRLTAWLSDIAREKGWQIAFDGQKVIHNHIFRNLDEAELAYSTLLHSLLDGAVQVAGTRLARRAFADAVLRLSPSLAELLQAYIPDLQMPEVDSR